MEQVVLFALVRSLFAALFLLPQLMTVPILVVYKEFRSLICYRIMFAIGLCDILQLLVMSLTIGAAVCGVEFNPVLEKTIGAFYTISWDLLYVLVVALALNRLVLVGKAVLAPGLANYQPWWERLLFNILFAGSAIYGVLGVGLFLSPLCGQKFRRNELMWSYDRSLPWTAMARDIEYMLIGACPFVALAAYLAIVVLLKAGPAIRERKAAAALPPSAAAPPKGPPPVAVVAPPKAPTASKQQRAPLLSAQERRILVQSVAMFVLLGVENGMTYPVSYPVPELYLLLCDLWLILAWGLNPLLYLALNENIRQRFLALWCSRCHRRHEEAGGPAGRGGGRGGGEPRPNTFIQRRMEQQQQLKAAGVVAPTPHQQQQQRTSLATISGGHVDFAPMPTAVVIHMK